MSKKRIKNTLQGILNTWKENTHDFMNDYERSQMEGFRRSMIKKEQDSIKTLSEYIKFCLKWFSHENYSSFNTQTIINMQKILENDNKNYIIFDNGGNNNPFEIWSDNKRNPGRIESIIENPEFNLYIFAYRLNGETKIIKFPYGAGYNYDEGYPYGTNENLKYIKSYQLFEKSMLDKIGIPKQIMQRFQYNLKIGKEKLQEIHPSKTELKNLILNGNLIIMCMRDLNEYYAIFSREIEYHEGHLGEIIGYSKGYKGNEFERVTFGKYGLKVWNTAHIDNILDNYVPSEKTLFNTLEFYKVTPDNWKYRNKDETQLFQKSMIIIDNFIDYYNEKKYPILKKFYDEKIYLLELSIKQYDQRVESGLETKDFDDPESTYSKYSEMFDEMKFDKENLNTLDILFDLFNTQYHGSSEFASSYGSLALKIEKRGEMKIANELVNMFMKKFLKEIEVDIFKYSGAETEGEKLGLY